MIRKAVATDIPRIIEIGKTAFTKAFANKNNREEVEEYLESTYNKSSLEEDLKNKTYFLVSDIENITGFILVSHTAPHKSTSMNYLMIERLYLDPAYIGQGLGSQLLKHIEAFAYQSNTNFLWLEVLQSNTKAVHFYKRHGFTTFDTAPGKFKADNEMDLWMKKTIHPIKKT